MWSCSGELVACDDELSNATRCVNGGQCYTSRMFQQEENSSLQSTTACCRCSLEWTGRRCETVDIGHLIAAEHEASVARSAVFAALCVVLLLSIVAIFVLFVYIRYRRKCRLSADRLFKATADELYRRPFNGRSSIVESLSRINSIRRSVNNEKDREDGIEVVSGDQLKQQQQQQTAATSSVNDVIVKTESHDTLHVPAAC